MSRNIKEMWIEAWEKIIQYGVKQTETHILDEIHAANALYIGKLEEQFQTVNELQKECDHLKSLINLMDINISFNRRYIESVIDREAWRLKQPNEDLRNALFHVAALQTADYIIENMNNIAMFENTFSLLNYGLSQIEFPGLIMEFGVYSGKTINHIAGQVKTNIVYGFDSFEGLPEDWRSGYVKGSFRKDNLPEVKENVHLIKGWFKDTLPGFMEEHKEVCSFVHIDCDLYSSTKDVFQALEGRIIPGTVIVFDEYFNYPGWQNHEYKAFKEFIEKSGLGYDYIGYVHVKEQVGVKIKVKGA